MTFRLSQRSINNLEGVDEKLCGVVHKAIQKTMVDFGVICGRRTQKEQIALMASGASKTMKSKHLDGHAVDLMAYVGSRGSWELSLYDNIADAVKQAAVELDTGIRWGAAWTVPDIREWEGTMEEAMQSYIDTRRKQGRRPFIDAPHFELI